MTQTFAQYLINKGLPKDIKVEKPLDKKALKELLIEINEKHPDQYPQAVMHLKRLGNRFATYETQTMGMDEISVPNKIKRDIILNKAEADHTKAKTQKDKDNVLIKMQEDLAANDLDGGTDSATEMVISGGMGGKKTQLMKLRTSPGVITDHQGNLIPKVIKKGYSEGLSVRDNWLQAIQGRKAFVDTQMSTASPGELSKVMSNLLNSSVVSIDDCGTQAGIQLYTKDDGVLDRYLAKAHGKFDRNTLITPEVQQALMATNTTKLLVRSPQTCQAKDNTVCAKCMGLKISTGKSFHIGDNAGMISAGILGQDVTQLALSSKHGNAMAKGKDSELVGLKGFRSYVESPKIYPNLQVLCEIYGVVHKLMRAPQGGWIVTIRETRKVPERFILNARKVPKQRGYYSYHIPPQRKLLEEIKLRAEVYPSMPLSDGNTSLRDVARLQSLGTARSQATEGMYQIYKKTGVNMDRRHLELLSRNMLNQVKIEKSPKAFPFRRGEIVEYNRLNSEVNKLNGKEVDIDEAEGMTLTENMHSETIGTMLTDQVIKKLKSEGVKKVKVSGNVETSAVFSPMTRALNNQTGKWLSKLNHRYIKGALTDAAMYGDSESVHSYSPIPAYAYGSEFGYGEGGKY